MTDLSDPRGDGTDLIVTSGCQSGGLAGVLAGMCPAWRVRALPIPEGEELLMAALGDAAAWATSLPADEVDARLAATGSKARVVRVPMIYFPAFHPDIIHVIGPDGSPMRSAAGPCCSAIVLWGWIHGASEDEICSWFRPDIYAMLGYPGFWETSLVVLWEIFAESDLDLDRWLLPLVPQGVFMLMDNHPAINGLVALARLIGEKLGADPTLLSADWARLVPDGLLATSTVWPVYPGIAEALGVRGDHVWRTVEGRLIGVDAFVSETLAGYRDIDPAAVDAPRIHGDTRFAAALGGVPIGAR